MTYMDAWRQAVDIAKETQEEAYVISKHVNGEWRYEACMDDNVEQAMRDGWTPCEPVGPPSLPTDDFGAPFTVAPDYD